MSSISESNFQPPSLYFENYKYPVLLATGILAAVAGLFLILAANKILYVNINSNLFTLWGQFAGYSALGIGCLLSLIAYVKILLKRPREQEEIFIEEKKSSEIIEEIEQPVDEDPSEADLQQAKEAFFKYLDDWIGTPDQPQASYIQRKNFVEGVKSAYASCPYELGFWSSFEVFPDAICNLPHLSSYHLKECENFRWPKNLHNSKKLKQLVIDKCNVQEIPDSIGLLKNLYALSLRNNQIQSLPNSIGNLANLEKLNLGNNRLSGLPDSLKNLKRLKELALDKNNFESLPVFIRELKNLEEINLTDNQLTTVPEWLFQLPKIERIYLSRNRFSAETVSQIQRYRDEAFVRTGRFIVCYADVFEPNINSFGLTDSANLNKLIQFWEKQFAELSKNAAKSAPLKCDNLVAHPFSNHLKRFLAKAKNCEDFKKPDAKIGIIFEIHEMLSAMEANEKFRELAFAMIEDGSGECSDRVAVFLDYIRIQRILSQTDDLNELKLAKLLIGLKRLEVLDKIAYKKAENAVDPLEIVLGYHVKLRNRLDLPLVTEEMLYPKLANIADAELDAAEANIRAETADFVSILSVTQPWAERMRKINEKEFEDLEASFELADPSSFAKEQDYRQAADEMKLKREQALQQKVVECTQKWLDLNRHAL